MFVLQLTVPNDLIMAMITSIAIYVKISHLSIQYKSCDYVLSYDEN